MKRTLSGICIMLACLLWLSGCSSEEKKPAQVAEPPKPAVEEKVAAAVEETKEAAKEAGATVAEATKEAVEEVKEAAAEAKEATEEKVSQAVDAVQEKAREVVEETKEVATEAKEKVQQAADTVAQKAAEAVAPAAGTAPLVVVYEARNGKVTFDHAVHAKAADCAACHAVMPPAKIELDKDSAHQLCTGCHKEMGVPSSCTDCHKK
ncbi:cytochrome c3 family protein [Geoalkalibacter sp.]|uniref:cytochrome c3 family protein n=1 Tax=Geoalkalibacter sp. TaxID=3041440 RepID=UPI00272EE1D5|nr:hypothetical protein [Geoalkalibacter sp.]